MTNTNRLAPLEAARMFVQENFPNYQGALLAGSVVRGEATDTSDLDIVIFDESKPSSYRQSLIDFGWPIEVFVHNLTSYQTFFESDYKRARPSLQRMVSEGLVLQDKGIIDKIKKEANTILEKGPEKWSSQTIETKRYFITDTLGDFIGSNNRAEELLIISTLANHLHEFILRTNGRWIGSSKWIIRELNQFNRDLTERYVDALETYYTTNDKKKIIEFTDEVLKPYGGRLFDGFTIG
ncbi:nucleotidyltransferase domain-containing protein [Pseudalkalibacillus decolorationis]|uniref:nucleotidyltransferase domain-containing protein n=1 Tax=Pseudalkalibacillus decolorationis TaxID=163879 RepID=UPI00214847F7|nr:nucleotidyltransferase domain-containing protein [Pseudalkalibacillus decolorationis]